MSAARRSGESASRSGAAPSWVARWLAALLLAALLGALDGICLAGPDPDPPAPGARRAVAAADASDDLGAPPAGAAEEAPAPVPARADTPAPTADEDPGAPPAADVADEASGDGASDDEAPADDGEAAGPDDEAADGEEPADGAGEEEAAPAQDDKPCPPLRVGAEDEDPLREPWTPHAPTYYRIRRSPCACPIDDHHAQLSHEYIELDPCNVPTRPASVFEVGDPFLAPGCISRGVCLPTGQIIRPRILVYGTYRTAVQYFGRGRGRADVGEWVNRLDVFLNLQLSATERLLVGMRPLNEGARFSGYQLEPDGMFVDGVNATITTLFFEGDFGEMFPRLSPSDFKQTDIGFSVGRQPIFIQGGIMIDDDLDAVGIVKNTLRIPGTSNLRLSGLMAWNNVNRGVAAVEDDSGYLVGLFGQIDGSKRTYEVDVAAITGADATTGDAVFIGLGAFQRLGKFHSTLRVNQSIALDSDTPATSTGTLLTSELAWSPTASEDNLYVNAALALDRYDGAARRVESGGPLSGLGLVFATAGLGQATTPLSPTAYDMFGGAVGHQRFFDHGRSNLVLELGGRVNIEGAARGMAAALVQYQRAIGGRVVFTAAAWANWLGEVEEVTGGGRVEFLVKF